MPPKSSNKKKKKTAKKAPNRSVDFVYCANCEKQLSNSDCVTCVCTKVRFCNSDCELLATSSRKHDCPGPPKRSTFLSGADPRSFTLHGAPENLASTQRELQETVHSKLKPLMLQYAMSGRSGSEYIMYMDLANEGSPEAAYMAGVACRHRLERADEFGRMSVLQSDMLAFKYFQQAADAGIGLAMQSLADLYFNGQGVRENRIVGNDWLWHACLINSFKARDILDSRSLIPLEMNSMIDQLHHMLQYAQQHVLAVGERLSCGGPNLTGLMTKLAIDGDRLANCLLPPFAAAVPTLSVGSRLRQGATGRVLVMGAKELMEMSKVTSFIKSHRMYVHYEYGRRGTCKSATAQTYSGTTRAKDSFYYRIPPLSQCDETFSEGGVLLFREVLLSVNFPVLCIHCEARSDPSQVFCMFCVEEARQRLEAATHGRVALSLYETLPARGLTAIWKDSAGKIQSETFKTYCRADVESALGLLVVVKPMLAHPLFVAQDPNLFWPLISYHGSIRAALEYVAPHVDWNDLLGEVLAAPEQEPLVKDTEPGDMLCRCGNELCFAMDREDLIGEVLEHCKGCESRMYCSNECLRADWVFHKHECAGGLSKRDGPTTDAVAYSLDAPKEGESVVLQNLVAKPELNGKVATVAGALNGQGRYPVLIHGASAEIAVKPDALLRLGIAIRDRSGKATTFKCAVHDMEHCKECNFDFTILNHLSKLSFSEALPTRQNIELIADRFLAQEGFIESEGEIDQTFKPECIGLSNKEKKALLTNLLNDMEKFPEAPLKDVAVAVAGLVCCSARSAQFVRAYCPPHLETALRVLYPE